MQLYSGKAYRRLASERVQTLCHENPAQCAPEQQIIYRRDSAIRLKDPKMGGLGGAVSLHDLKLSNHKPNVIGALREECKSLVQAFFQAQRFA